MTRIQFFDSFWSFYHADSSFQILLEFSLKKKFSITLVIESEQICVPGQELAFPPVKTPPQLHPHPRAFSQIPPSSEPLALQAAR